MENQPIQIDAYLQNLINQGFRYAPGIEAFTFYPDSEEEEEEKEEEEKEEEEKEEEEEVEVEE